MQVSLRTRQHYGGWWRGLGDEGSDDAAAGYGAQEGGGVDPSTLYPEPGYNITPSATPAPDLSAEEFAAEQDRARAWLAQLPNIVNVAGKVTMSAAQLATGIQQGMVKPSTTCPSGYLVGTNCVAPVAQTAAALIPGLPNSTLAMIGGGLLILVLIGKQGGRR